MRRALLLSLVLLPSFGMAQFTYVGLDFGYQHIKFAGRSNSITANSDLRMGIMAMWRPVRSLAIGVRYDAITDLKHTFSFKNAPTPDGSNFFEFEYSHPDYKPVFYSYGIHQSSTATLLLRLVSNTPMNLYAEGRMSLTSFDEKFRFWRFSAPEVYDEFGFLEHGYLPYVSIDERHVHKLVSPGIRIGLMPQFKKGFFLDFNLGYDFHAFGHETSYSYAVEHEWSLGDDRHELVTFESQLRGTKKAFSTFFGVGIFF